MEHAAYMAVWLPSQVLLNKVILVWKPLLQGVSAGAVSSRKWKQDRKRIVGPRLPPIGISLLQLPGVPSPQGTLRSALPIMRDSQYLVLAPMLAELGPSIP